MKKFFLILASILVCTLTYGQRNDNREYWNTWEYTPKDGMRTDFEKAAAKKTATFNKTPETAIITFRYVTGPKSGTYLRVEGLKSPADYDLDRSAEGDYWNQNVSKFIAKNAGQQRWQRLNDGSYNYDPKNPGPPSKIINKTTYSVKADKIGHFRRFMSRLAKMAEQRNWPVIRTLYRLESGGNRNEFVLVAGFDSYKRASGPEFENTFEEDYDTLFGYGSLDEDSNNFDASLEYWGEMRETLHLVPEMSTKITN